MNQDSCPKDRRNMEKHTIGDLHQLQALPLSVKIKKTEYRIREWAEHYGKNGIFLAFSGGRDSSVLMHIARKIYPDIPAVYVNTGLEFPEVREFVKRQENVEILNPKMNFRQVIGKYGYPFIGKEVAGCVYGARRYMEKLAGREMGLNSCSTIPNHSYMADLAGIERRGCKQDALYQSLIRGEIPGTDIKAPARYLILQGKYRHKENGVETPEYSRMYNKERYKFFLEAPFEISERCCYVMKKSPMHSYAKKTGRMPVTAQLASESRLRTTNWLKNGCNGFHMKSPSATQCLSGWNRMCWNIFTITGYRLRMSMGKYGQSTGEKAERQMGGRLWMRGFLIWKNLFTALPDVSGPDAVSAVLDAIGKNLRTGGSLQKGCPTRRSLIICCAAGPLMETGYGSRTARGLASGLS